MTRMFGWRPRRASLARAASSWSGNTKAGSRCGAMGVVGLAIGSKGGMAREHTSEPRRADAASHRRWRDTMKITIIGAGNVGRTLGAAAQRVGHAVTYLVRDTKAAA